MQMKNMGFIRTEYSFTSGTGQLENHRYFTEYTIRIFLDDFRLDDLSDKAASLEIGQASVTLFLLDLALNEREPRIEVFDPEYIRLYEDLYDDDDELIAAIYGGREIDSGNVLYIRRLALLPQWRGRGMGAKILKDIIWRFTGSCGLVVACNQPLQFEEGILEETDLWVQQLLLSGLTQNKEEARQRVAGFFTSAGFREVAALDLFYLNMTYVNSALNAVSLDDAEEL